MFATGLPMRRAGGTAASSRDAVLTRWPERESSSRGSRDRPAGVHTAVHATTGALARLGRAEALTRDV